MDNAELARRLRLYLKGIVEQTNLSRLIEAAALALEALPPTNPVAPPKAPE